MSERFKSLNMIGARQSRKNQAGLSLMEVLVAMGIAGIVAGLIPQLMLAHQSRSVSVEQQSKAALIAESYLEGLVTTDYPPYWNYLTYDETGALRFKTVSQTDPVSGVTYNYEIPDDPDKYPMGFVLESSVKYNTPVDNVNEVLITVTWKEKAVPKSITIATYKGSGL